MARTLTRHRNTGFALQDVMLAIALFLLISGVYVREQIRATQQYQSTAAAEQMSEVVGAAKQYLQTNAATLQGAANTTNAVMVSTAAMQAQGLLNPSGTYRNAFGQTYRLYVLEPAPGNLVGFVITYGGQGAAANTADPAERTFADKIVLSAAIKVGSEGGFVATGNLPTASVASRLYGAHGGWTYNLGPTNIPNPGPGHLASIIYLADGQLVADYLYRNAVPGNPEANRMNVAIDMDGNNINNVDTLDAETVQASNDVRIQNPVSNDYESVGQGLIGWSGLVRNLASGIPRSYASVACPTPSSSWKYVAVPVNWRTPGGDGPAGGVRVRLESAGSTYRARIQVATETGWRTAETSAQAWVMVHCS